MYIYNLIENIVNKLNLEKNINYISVYDSINLYENYNEVMKIFYDNKNNEELNDVEKYIIKVYSSKEYNLKKKLSQNYYSNFLGDIFFILGNLFSLDTPQFDVLYKNKNNIKNINNLLIKNYENIINSDLHKFYNLYMIKKWEKTIIKRKLNKDDYFKFSKLEQSAKEKKWNKYEKIWKIYNDSCHEFLSYIKKLISFYENKNIQIVGCFNFGKKLYECCLESHLGMNVNPLILEKWAQSELQKLIKKMKYYIKKINPSIDSNLSHIKMLNLINKSQLFKSEQEMIDHHKEIIKKYETIYVKKYGFLEFKKCNLVVFNDKYMAGGYYFNNNFYLNTANWKEKHRYSTESLVLHEAVPGHHQQIHLVKYLENDNNLLLHYFYSITNGFVEGWGLFSEYLGIDQTNWDIIGQIEHEILRTLRVIVDIGIHYHGKTPNEIIDFMKENLSGGHNEIEAEVYRYVSKPGQAVSYKVGSEIFKQILKKNNINNYLDDKAIEIYKQILLNGLKPLKFLIKEYNLNENELFKV